MGKKTKLAKGRRDRYYWMAKEQGYRGRAAFKLVQLNNKYNFLSSSRCLVDLCAAPGGWSQVAVKAMPVGSHIVAIDLDKIPHIDGVTTFQADITTQRCRNLLTENLKGWEADTFVHDGAPNVSGKWTTDAYNQNVLVLYALNLASEFLKSGGTFVTKVFRSKDYTSILWVLNQLFAKVEATKPSSSRDSSAEIFVVCLGFRGAKRKLDPRLFDPAHVFKDVDMSKKALGIVDEDEDEKLTLKTFMKDREGHGKKGRSTRRGGYEDYQTENMFYSALPAASFIVASNPVKMFERHTSIDLTVPLEDTKMAADGSSATTGESSDLSIAQLTRLILSHPSTTPDIIECCRDLQRLGHTDFKHLLKWRQDVRKHLGVLGLELAKNGTVSKSSSNDGTTVHNEEEAEEEMKDDRTIGKLQRDAELVSSILKGVLKDDEEEEGSSNEDDESSDEAEESSEESTEESISEIARKRIAKREEKKKKKKEKKHKAALMKRLLTQEARVLKDDEEEEGSSNEDDESSDEAEESSEESTEESISEIARKRIAKREEKKKKKKEKKHKAALMKRLLTQEARAHAVEAAVDVDDELADIDVKTFTFPESFAVKQMKKEWAAKKAERLFRDNPHFVTLSQEERDALLEQSLQRMADEQRRKLAGVEIDDDDQASLLTKKNKKQTKKLKGNAKRMALLKQEREEDGEESESVDESSAAAEREFQNELLKAAGIYEEAEKQVDGIPISDLKDPLVAARYFGLDVKKERERVDKIAARKQGKNKPEPKREEEEEEEEEYDIDERDDDDEETSDEVGEQEEINKWERQEALHRLETSLRTDKESNAKSIQRNRWISNPLLSASLSGVVDKTNKKQVKDELMGVSSSQGNPKLSKKQKKQQSQHQKKGIEELQDSDKQTTVSSSSSSQVGSASDVYGGWTEDKVEAELERLKKEQKQAEKSKAKSSKRRTSEKGGEEVEVDE
ncbi:AdoMet-dependent rRNA methyltransferase SPB1, partial [Aduncisulcus paluster]